MKKYSKNFLTEVERFQRFFPSSPVKPNDLGLKQFYDLESSGIRPTDPNPFFTLLLDGKRWWEWQLNEISNTYLTDDWWGWAIFEDEYKNDPSGLKQIKRRCGILS